MKVSIPTAVKGGKNKQDLSFPVIQTLGISDTRCVGSIKMEQGDRVHVNLRQFSRFSPLVAPTFGDFKIVTHAFWIPTRLVWPHYLEFLDDSLDASFDDIKVPLNFSLKDLYDAFILGDLIVEKANWSTSNPDGYEKKADGKPKYDVNIFDAQSDQGTSYNFSAHGRLVFSSMQALGYAIPTFLITSESDVSSLTQYYHFWMDEDYSLYPLLSFFRVYFDWIYPSQYVTQQGLGFFFIDDFTKEWIAQSTKNHAGYFLDIFSLMFNPYDKSFFTSLWAKPNQVAQNTSGGRGQSNLGVAVSQTKPNGSKSIDIDSSTGNSLLNDTFIYQNTNTQNETLSAFSLRWLESISDFVLRSNIGGSKVQDFLKSHFGFVPSDIQANVSTWINSFSDKVLIQDVTNVAQSSGNVLGEQGGKAISSGNGSIKFEASEQGMIIFVTCVHPTIGYYQGVAKECRKITSRFDMFLPDFDSVSMEAIPRRAIFNQYRSYEDMQKVGVSSLDDSFGYAPRDAERKIHRAILSGDFLFNSRNTGLDSYHTMRDVLYGRNNLALDARFLEADNQTQRIFAYTGTEQEGALYSSYDKIFNQMYFEVTKFSMQKSLSQSLPFFDEDGNRVNVDYQGKSV